MNRDEAEVLLKEKFGLLKFYDEQWLTIEKILNGERVLMIEKTGYGKSLCFQFPAIVFDGITVIFSPLIALMRDQVKKLKRLGINARCINYEQDMQENTDIMRDAKDGKIKILYIAPERQENYEWIEATHGLNLSMVVVDEAHCISVWGHDFRPAFKRIINIVNLLPNGFPVLATTATATKKVEADIAKQMGGDMTVIRGNLVRENLQLFAVRANSEDEKLIYIGKLMQKIPGSGIVYTGTRVDTEIYAKWFDKLGIPSIGYNAGLDGESRIMIENGFMNNKWKCIVSTNALGMGIDKPDIRFIIHTQFPQSPIHYYQEIGRAGRDGKPTYIILLYNPEDRNLPEAFIEGARPSIKKYEKVLDAIKNEMLGERELIKKINLKSNQLRVIEADLIEQKIIREVSIGRSKKFEYISNAPKLNVKVFEDLRNAKMKDLERMIDYIECTGSRMKFLCDYLGDNTEHSFNNCDNTGLKKIKINITSEWTQKINEFKENYFPVLDVEGTKSNLVNGVAGAYYGFSNVGTIIHRCKYENGGDYPDYLINMLFQAYKKKFNIKKFDIIIYVPPTISGDLVKNFAVKISELLNIPISHNLEKARDIKPQKIFENAYLKRDNVKGAFKYSNPKEIENKNILLIDDIFDSGATIKEIGQYLTKLKVNKIAPLVIAKTVGGDSL